jgi:hypothetical protein
MAGEVPLYNARSTHCLAVHGQQTKPFSALPWQPNQYFYITDRDTCSQQYTEALLRLPDNNCTLPDNNNPSCASYKWQQHLSLLLLQSATDSFIAKECGQMWHKAVSVGKTFTCYWPEPNTSSERNQGLTPFV